MRQAYHRGDLVRVAKDLGPSLSHFTADCDAIVIGSYSDQYGGGRNSKSYTLWLKGHGASSWYEEHQLTLIERGREDLLKAWEAQRAAADKLHADLDWVFSHGDEVLRGAHGATLQALADCFGLHNLWGSRGEGITYYENSLLTLELAAPFLRTGDKAGWLNWCRTKGKAKQL